MTEKEKIEFSIKQLANNIIDIVDSHKNNYDAREESYKEIERFLVTLSRLSIIKNNSYARDVKNRKVNS
tara:strand:- start:959 stop:1165 length:207 start_codon:yes stop_codon:yes gene_type:complete